MTRERDKTILLVPVQVEDAPYVLAGLKAQALFEDRLLIEYPFHADNDMRREKRDALRALAVQIERRVNYIAAALVAEI